MKKTIINSAKRAAPSIESTRTPSPIQLHYKNYIHVHSSNVIHRVLENPRHQRAPCASHSSIKTMGKSENKGNIKIAELSVRTSIPIELYIYIYIDDKGRDDESPYWRRTKNAPPPEREGGGGFVRYYQNSGGYPVRCGIHGRDRAFLRG